MSAATQSQGSGLPELARLAAVLAMVFGGATCVLVGLDGAPAWIAGDSRDVRRAATVAEAERRLGARLLIPFYFPQTVAWPPGEIRFVMGPVPAAALSLTTREGEPYMLLAQTLAAGDVPARLLPPVEALQTDPIPMAGSVGQLSRFVGQDAAVWREASWRQDGRHMVLRSRGPLEEMLRMARSAREAP